MELRPGPIQSVGKRASAVVKAKRPVLVTALAAAATFWTGATAQVMMLPGQFDVSPTGAAVYSVPIEVPPGTAGMSPALTLDYDSDGGNGLLGVGWSLGGLPSIGRCPRTKATDNVRGRVDFTTNDRFCMDGQRLIVVNGIYGAAGSEYRTEIEGFTKIIAYSAQGTGPAYFRAWTKSGQIIEFGKTAGAKVREQGTSTVRSWAVNQIADTKGNYLDIAYYNDSSTGGEVYPTQIDYTGNSNTGLLAYNSVRFEYESRPDITPVYIAGTQIRTTKRLKRIKTYEGPTNVARIYELAYSEGSSTDRSKITSIALCDGSATPVCLPATNFAMTDASLTFPTLSTNPIATSEMGASVALYVGDWNGDGYTDAMTWNPSNGTNKWFVNNGALSFTTTTNPIAAAQITGVDTELHLGDWDGDTITDIMWLNPANGWNRWFTNNGSLAFTQTTNPIAVADLIGAVYFGDWNRDAITDVMRIDYGANSGANKWFINNGALGFPSPVNNPIPPYQLDCVESPPDTFSCWTAIVADWNSDGAGDVLTYRRVPEGSSAVNWRFWFNNGSVGFGVTTEVSAGAIGASAEFVLGDWNADGTADLLTYEAGTGVNRWFLGSGLGLSSVSNSPITPSTITGQFILNVGDWNADGMSDVMFHLPSSGTNRWFTTSWSSAGALQFAYSADPIATSNLSGTSGAMAFGDWNGRGFDMPMFRLASNGTNRWWRNDAALPPERLASVTTGLLSPTDITYQPLTAASVYTKDSNAVYPQIDIEAPFYVVSRVDADNGAGGDYSSIYSYAGAKIDVWGRGFLGFRQQVATDLQTNIVQTLTFDQVYPFIGFVQEDRKVKDNTPPTADVVLNDRGNAYLSETLGGGPGAGAPRQWPFLNSVTEASKDLNGATFPIVTTTYEYDCETVADPTTMVNPCFGNPLTVTVSTPDTASRTTTNTYDNFLSPNWIIGRLKTSTVTSTTPDTPPAPTGCQTNCGPP